MIRLASVLGGTLSILRDALKGGEFLQPCLLRLLMNAIGCTETLPIIYEIPPRIPHPVGGVFGTSRVSILMGVIETQEGFCLPGQGDAYRLSPNYDLTGFTGFKLESQEV